MCPGLQMWLFKQEQCNDKVSSHTVRGASVDSVGWQQLSASTTAAHAFHFNISQSVRSTIFPIIANFHEVFQPCLFDGILAADAL